MSTTATKPRKPRATKPRPNESPTPPIDVAAIIANWKAAVTGAIDGKCEMATTSFDGTAEEATAVMEGAKQVIDGVEIEALSKTRWLLKATVKKRK